MALMNMAMVRRTRYLEEQRWKKEKEEWDKEKRGTTSGDGIQGYSGGTHYTNIGHTRREEGVSGSGANLRNKGFVSSMAFQS
eukprot:g37811.t1